MEYYNAEEVYMTLVSFSILLLMEAIHSLTEKEECLCVLLCERPADCVS